MAERVAPIDVIIPVFNEEENLPTFFRRIETVALPLRLIFVDNGSKDGTLELLRNREGITLIEHDRNEGYGGSIIDGIARVRAERLVIIDADCEFPPESIPDLVSALNRHEVVYASRFLGGGAIGMPWLRILGNRVISGLFNRLYDQRVTDLYTGFKAMHTTVARTLRLERKGFEHVLEMAVRLCQQQHRIAEVPITYQLRQAGRSKMDHVSETVKFFCLLIRYRLFG